MRRIDKGVAVHDAVAEELGVLQAGNHMEDALLFAEGQVGLEANQVIGGLLLVLGAQLNCRPGTATGARVGEPDGLHGAKADGILARARNLLGRLAGLEQVTALKILSTTRIGRGECLDKGLVLFLVERGIEIVATPLLLVARLREQHVHIERRGIDDRGGRVKERQGVTTDKLHDLPAQCRRAQGARGDNHMTSGIWVTSPWTTSILGRAATSASTSSENLTRSTARAPPAGTAAR